jgi:hypothetical protein
LTDTVRSQHPPAWLVAALRPVISSLVPGPAGRFMPGMGVLRFRGRRSGREYVVPIGIYDYQGSAVAFTDGRWAANFDGGWPVLVSRRGEEQEARGDLVTDPGFVGPAIRAVLDAGTSPRLLGLWIAGGHRPTDAELAATRDAIVIHPHAIA